jgi:hypothetical protein
VALVYLDKNQFIRLNDDWAYGNETQSKPYDFHVEESVLRQRVAAFNLRRYKHLIAPNGI